MFYQKRMGWLVFSGVATLCVMLALFDLPHAHAATAEAMTAVGTGHLGAGVIGQGKFWSTSHLSANEISQAKARDLEEFIEAESQFGWIAGVSQLKYTVGPGFTTGATSASTRSYLFGLTAEASANLFADFMLNFEETKALNAADSGIDFKLSYVIEWGEFKSLIKNSFVSEGEPGSGKTKLQHKKVTLENDFLTYPYLMLTLNPLYYQHRRTTNTSDQFNTKQAGLIFSAKFFPNEKRAFRFFHSSFGYNGDKVGYFYTAEELKSLVPVRAGPMGSMALIRSLPKHYTGFSFQSFTSGNWETELGINRTSYEVGGLGVVLSPNFSAFRFFPTKKIRVGGSLDLFRGGVSAYSAGLHFTKYW